MKAVAIMTPDPKYFAKLGFVSSGRCQFYTVLLIAHSKTAFGMMFRSRERYATTGKVAPNMDPTPTMKIDAMRSPSMESSPPPLPQFTVSPSSRVARRRRTATAAPSTFIDDIDVYARDNGIELKVSNT